MAADADAFSAIAVKLATVQKFLVTLVSAALCFAAADLVSGRQASLELAREAQEVRAFALVAEDAVARLRYLLSHAYPDRSLGERQRLTLLVNDLRRARRALESSSGVDAMLLKYRPPVLEATEGEPSRRSLQQELSRLRPLLYFNGPQPGGDGLGTHPFVDVGINDLSSEAALHQLPVAHVAALLTGALALPSELSDALEAFVRQADPTRRDPLTALHQALVGINERGRRLDVAFTHTGRPSSAVAQQLLDEFVRRGGPGDASDDAAVRATKYASPSLEALSQLLTDVQLAYYSELSKARGVRDVQVPGTPLQLPGYFFLFALPAVLTVLILWKQGLARAGREAPLPAASSRVAAEVTHGSLVLRLMGVQTEGGRVVSGLQVLLVALAPVALAVPLAWARGAWTLWITGLPALLVLGIELRLAWAALRDGAPLRAWPAPGPAPTPLP